MCLPDTVKQFHTNGRHVQITEGAFLQAADEPGSVGRKDLETNDIVIAIVGPPGSGKSTLIAAASGCNTEAVPGTSRSFTNQLNAVKFWDQESERHVVLVDTPSIDTFVSGQHILSMISEWLVSSYNKRKLLSGILYLYRIMDNRVAGSSLESLEAFKRLCKNDVLNKVYLTTTMWDEINPVVGERRLDELKSEHWRTMIARGAQVACCRSDDDSSKKLIRRIISSEKSDVPNQGAPLRPLPPAKNRQEVPLLPRNPYSFNIVIFGEAGVGKSSIVNLIADDDIAETSGDAQGCTLQSKRYAFPVGTRTFNTWDTVGLGEPSFSTTDYLGAIERTYLLIRQIEANGGLDLLLFCIPGSGSRITKTMVSNYRLFFEVLCEKRIPISAIVTRLEYEKESMEGWWVRNKEHISKSGLEFGGHACITGRREHPRAAEGRAALELLLLGYDHKGRYAMPPSSDWFLGVLKRLPSIPRSRELKNKQQELERLLRERCNMSSADAQQLAETLTRSREEDCRS